MPGFRSAGGVLVVAVMAAAAAGVVVSRGARDDDAPTTPARAAVAPAPLEAGATDRLAARLAAMPAPQDASRNPFRFRTRARPAAAVPERPLTSLLQSLSTNPPPSPPTLIGIAEDPGPDGPIRTAILSSGRNLFLAKEGEPIDGRYRVTRIGADVVELTEEPTGVVMQVSLR